MNILVIHEIDYMRKVVFDVHLLAEAMSLIGHKVYVLTYESMWGLDGERMPKEMIVWRALPRAVVNLVSPSFVRMPIVSRASAFVSHYFAIRDIIKKKGIDAIVLYSVPTNGLQAVYWARKFNIPIVFRSIDAIHQLVPYPILRSVTKIMESLVYSSVDGIMALTPKLCGYTVQLGADTRKVSVLPMTVDTDMFCPLGDNLKLRERWGFNGDDKIVLFMGTLFNFSGLDSFIPQFKYVVAQEPKAKLLIVGDGSQRAELEGIIKTCGLEGHAIITGFQPYQDMPHYISLADVCVNTFVDNDATRDIFPGKTVQFLACGKPLVMRPLGGVKSMIGGEGQGVVYADGDDRMVDKILLLLREEERRIKVGQRGLRYARENYAYGKVARQLETELERLIEAKHG